ncbi:MAG TPA: ABATE domain-containing protein, partial [Terriglobales bacterium]|nr:ABATE domain-containing protein [Terriglobales bacterium]
MAKNLAIDFANTVVDPRGEPAGAIRSWHDLITFLEIAAAMARDQSARYRSWAKRDPRDCSATFALALELRDEIRQILAALAGGTKVRAEWVRSINRVLEDQAGWRKLASTKGTWELTRVTEKESSSELLLPIAESAAEIVRQGAEAHIRKCANPECILYFQDPAGRRRWCSMA